MRHWYLSLCMDGVCSTDQTPSINLYRFKLTDNPMFPCEEEEEEEEQQQQQQQTTDNLIFQCKKLGNGRNDMIKEIKKHWWRLAYEE